MSRFYNKLENDFTQIPNTILQDIRMGALAFKLYCYICFRIGRDKEWEFYNNEILEHFKEGKYSLMKAKKELIQFGYLEKVKQNTKKDGTFGGCDYIIYKEPLINNISPTSEIPSTISPTSEIPSTVKRVTNNKDIEINKELKNKDCNKNSFLKKEGIYKLFSNKCAIQDSENLSIINNDFSEHELNLLSEYAYKRLYLHSGKRNNGIKNTLQAFKIVYKKAKDLKLILGINFVKLFEIDQDGNYKYLLTTNGEIVQNLDPWIVERMQKQQQTNTTFSHYGTRQRSNTNSTRNQSNTNDGIPTLTDIINEFDS